MQTKHKQKCSDMPHIKEDAYSGTGGIFIRDTACDTTCSLWFNDLWPNQGQTIPRIIPRIAWCSKLWRMILGRMPALKRKKSVVNNFKNLIEAMVMKEKRLPQISYLIKLWIKRRAEFTKVMIILTSHHTGRVTIHFVCVWNISGLWRMK